MAMTETDPTFRAAMRSLIGERWGVVWRTIPAAADPDNLEAVHDIRVASRRLRAAMDVATGAFPAGWYAPLHRTAKEITAALGEVRDRDVLIQHLAAELERSPMHEKPGIALLIDRVERQRAKARTAMTAYLRDLTTNGTPEETIRRFGSSADPQSPVAPVAPRERGR